MRLAASAVSTSKAVSARTVSRSGSTSAKPPRTKMRRFLASGRSMLRTPGRRVEITGAWPRSTAKSPCEPGKTTCSASADRSTRSGLTNSNVNVSAILSPSTAVIARDRLQASGLVFLLFPARLDLGLYVLGRLELRPAEGTEEQRMVHHPRLLVLQVDETNRHVEHAVATLC